MLLRRLAATALSIASITSVAACGDAASTDEPSSTVVVSAYPWAWLARQVAGDELRVHNLAGAGTDPHAVSLTARQVVDIKRALLVVYVKGMQPAVDEAVTDHATNHAFDVASAVNVLPLARTTVTTHGTGDEHPEEGDGHHHHGAFDPHIWLDPVRFAAVAEALGDRLARADPSHAQGYRTRAAHVAGTLHDLDDDYRAGLRNCRSRTIVTSHASFGYLADRYDLQQVGVAGANPEVPPSPARLAEVARFAEATDVKVIFVERLANSKAAATVATEIGARTQVLDPVASPPPDSSADYLFLMRDNLSALRKALGCR